MQFNDEQIKYVKYVREKIVPALKGLDKEELAIPINNIEWNLKKVLGETGSETIDAETYAQRTKSDFKVILKSVDEESEEGKFAQQVVDKIEDFFGVKKPEDPEVVMERIANTSSDDLDWRHSIVDLLKALGADSSWDARKGYAVALGYPESEISKADSARMNLWLHEQLMNEVARNGGKAPEYLA